MIMFNNVYLKFDQQGFQEMLFVGLHELTHVLGFSASMYSTFTKNPLVQDADGLSYLSTPRLQ